MGQEDQEKHEEERRHKQSRERFEDFLETFRELNNNILGLKMFLAELRKSNDLLRKEVQKHHELVHDFGDVSANGLLPAVADLVQHVDLLRQAMIQGNMVRDVGEVVTNALFQPQIEPPKRKKRRL
jgi:hypothetical protein